MARRIPRKLQGEGLAKFHSKPAEEKATIKSHYTKETTKVWFKQSSERNWEKVVEVLFNIPNQDVLQVAAIVIAEEKGVNWKQLHSK